MGEFQRSRSKVWWSSECEDLGSARGGGSPGGSSSGGSHRSQDSGFSDSEPPPAPPAQPPAPAEAGEEEEEEEEVIAAPRSPEQSSSRGPRQHSPIRSLRSACGSPCSPSPQALSFELHRPAHTSTPKSVGTPALGKKHGRPVNLFNEFNRSCKESGSCVQRWLTELRGFYEPECVATLQSKSLAMDLNQQVAAMAAASTDAVHVVQERTRLISAEFTKLCRQLESGQMEHVGPLVQSLVGNITEFLRHHVGSSQDEEMSALLSGTCDRLRVSAARCPLSREALSKDVTLLGQQFTSLVDSALKQQITMLVAVLEEPASEMALRAALASLADLGMDGAHLSRLVAQCEGVRALLTIVLESRASSIRIAALRSLATVCCVSESIRQLEQCGGVEVLAEFLSEEAKPEAELSEAAAVLAQITAPWVEDNQSVKGLSLHLSSLVKSLTRLMGGTESCETLLLSAAALANLTFMEPQVVWALLECGTAGELLRAVRARGPHASVFLQEQAATLLANMAAVPESRPHLARHRAVVSLLCFLQIRHSPLQRAPEITAAERVQQKSAIALSRLCSDPEVAAEVVQLQGVERLVRLCKEERERNHSDGVLVACLAALRKIAANCGSRVIEDLDATELVEPRLLDSFLLYSSRQESYV